MTDEQIKHMVQRFLGWRLPEHFSPDAGISFKPTFNEHMPFGPQYHNPVGTNLFTAEQAEAMVRYMIDDMTAVEPSACKHENGSFAVSGKCVNCGAQLAAPEVTPAVSEPSEPNRCRRDLYGAPCVLEHGHAGVCRVAHIGVLAAKQCGTGGGGSSEAVDPLTLNGVRHKARCAVWFTPAGEAIRRQCNCGASVETK